MSNVDGWLAKKYQVQQEQADTANIDARARANLFNVQAQTTPSQVAAQNADAYGRATAARSQAYGTDVTASLAPSLAASDISNRRATSGYLGAEAGSLSRPDAFAAPAAAAAGAGRFATAGLPMLPSLQPAQDDNTPAGPLPGGWSPVNPDQGLLRESTGTSKVPGKGTGKVDTQPAMLAPGEAVLNKAAAEHLGRNTIDLLNAIGQQKMGTSDQQQPQQMQAPPQQPGYASGTSDTFNWNETTPRQGYPDATTNMTDPPGGRWMEDPWGRGPSGDKPAAMHTTTSWLGKPSAATQPANGDKQGTQTPGYAAGTSQVGNDWRWIDSNGTPQTSSPPSAPMPVQPDLGQRIMNGLDRRPAPPTKPDAKPPGYAKGTSKVPAKAPAKGAPKSAGKKAPGGDQGGAMPPGLLAAIMNMGGGPGGPGGGMGAPGAGMPPGGAPPMPMPMPMAAPPQMPGRR